MNNVFISTSAFGSSVVLEKGQGFYFPIIAKAGASGVEVRRELFSENDSSLKELRILIEKEKLISVYSVPLPICKDDGELNEVDIKSAVKEAIELGSKFIKFSLGKFDPSKSSINNLKKLLVNLEIKKFDLHVTVENDQTMDGGNVHLLNRFLEECLSSAVSIGMTFDIGNWNWTNEDAYSAAVTLEKYVEYIHLKHVEVKHNKRVTLPLPIEQNSKWRDVLAVLPKGVPRTIEFPIEGEDLKQNASQYVQLLAKA